MIGVCGHEVKNIEPHFQDLNIFTCRDCGARTNAESSGRTRTKTEYTKNFCSDCGEEITPENTPSRQSLQKCKYCDACRPKHFASRGNRSNRTRNNKGQFLPQSSMAGAI